MVNRLTGICVLVYVISSIIGESSTNFGCNLPTTCGQGSKVEKDLYDLWYNDPPGSVYTYEFTIIQTSSVQTTDYKPIKRPTSEDDVLEGSGEGSGNDDDTSSIQTTAWKPISISSSEEDVVEGSGNNEYDPGNRRKSGGSDNQTATVTGRLKLIRGTGNMSCTASFMVTNISVKFQDMKETSEAIVQQPLVLEGPTVFPFIFFNSSQDNDDDLQSICVPEGEDVWKTNLRRSLAFMMASNVKLFAELKRRESEGVQGVFVEDATALDEDVFGETKNGVSNYEIWIGNNSSALANLRLTSHSQDPHKIEVFQNLTRTIPSFWDFGELDNKLSEKKHDEFFEEWMDKLDTFSNFGVTSCVKTLKNGELKGAICRELQRVATPSYLAVDIGSTSKIRVIQNEHPMKYHRNNANWNPDGVVMTKVSTKFDPTSNGPSSDAGILEGFHKLMGSLCGHTENPKAFLEFRELMRRILPLVPIKELREQYRILVQDQHCGVNAFLQYLATSPSDDTVEFMVELITNGDDSIDSEVFSNFLWAATLLPTYENDNFQRYAGARTHSALHKLLDSKLLYHRKYDMSDSDFLLHMVGLLNKEKKLIPFEVDMEEILPRVNYLFEIDKFISIMNNGPDPIDRATFLQVRKGVEKHGQQLDPDNDDELEDDYERLMTHNPCTRKHLKYLQQLFDDDKKGEDLKIMAYLFMRKCYIPEWRELVQEYVNSNIANKGVIDFIVQHVNAISESYKSLEVADDEQVVLAAGNTSSRSEMGSTIFKTVDGDYKFYGHSAVRRFQIGFELNIVKGKEMLPRLITIEMREHGSNGEQDTAELEIIRLKSYVSGNSEILVTFRECGVAIYTTTIVLDQSKLLQLLQDGSNSALFDFLRNFSSTNWSFLSQLVSKNRKMETMSRILVTETIQSFPSISGLPIKTNANFDKIFSFNFTHHFRQNIDGYSSYTLRFNPAMALKAHEQISVGLGHAEILGYKLSATANFNWNFELVLSRTRDGIYRARIGLGRDNSKINTFEYASVNIMKLERFQVLNAFTEMTESGHIWKTYADSIVKIELDKISDLLRNRVCCVNGLMNGIITPGAGPFYFNGSVFCDVPSAIVIEAVPRFDANHISMDVKIYPEGGTQLEITPQYVWNVEMSTSGGNISVQARLVTPSIHHELNVTLKTQSSETLWEHSLMVNCTGNNGSYGFELYKRFKSQVVEIPWFRNPNEIGQSGGGNPIILTLDLGSNSSFGLVAWSPIPNFNKVNILVWEGQMDKKKSWPRFHYLLESDGIHPSLNSKLEYKFCTEYRDIENATMSEAKDNESWDRRHDFSFTVENGALGRLELNYSLLNVPMSVPREAERYRMIGAFEMTYGRREWNTISGNHTYHFEEIDSKGDDGRSRTKESTFEGDVRFSQFPQRNSLYKYVVVVIYPDVGSPGYPLCKTEENVMVEFMPKLDPNHKTIISFSKSVEYNTNGDDQDRYACLLISTIRSETNVDFPGTALIPAISWRSIVDEIRETMEYKIKLIDIRSNILGFVSKVEEIEFLHFKYQMDDASALIPNPKLYLEASINSSDKSVTFQTEHSLTQMSDVSIKYDGSFSLPAKGYRLDFDGVMEPIVSGGWLLYKRFDIKITDKLPNKSYNFSLNEIPDDSAAKHYYKLLLVGNHPMFDASVKLLKEKSLEGYSVMAKSTVPGVYSIRIDAGSGKLDFVLELHRKELKVQSKIGWPTEFLSSEDTTHVLSLKVDATDLTGGQSWMAFNSVSDFKYINETASMTYFKGRSFGIYRGWPKNFIATSKSTFKIRDEPSQSLNISYHIHPHEADRPTVMASLLDKSGDKYSIQINDQALHQATPSLDTDTYAKWCRIERPSVPSFTLSTISIVKRKHQFHRQLGETVAFIDSHSSFKNDFTMSHHGFFWSGLDTEFNSHFTWNQMANYWSEYDVESNHPTHKVVSKNASHTMCSFDLAFEAVGNQRLPETKLSARVDVIEPENKTLRMFEAHYDVYSGERHDDIKLSYNVSLGQEDLSTSIGDGTDNSQNEVEYSIREFVDENSLNSKATDIGWSWVQGIDVEDDYNANQHVAEGIHRYKMLFKNLRNFELKANHEIDCFLGKYIWEDKLYSKNPSLDDTSLGFMSSKLFSVSASRKRNSWQTVAELFYPMFHTKVSSIVTMTEPNALDQFNHTNYILKASSVLLDDDMLMELDSGTFSGLHGIEYKTHFHANLAKLTPKTNFTLYWNRYNVSSAEFFSELVTYTATLILDPEGYGSKSEWKSVSAILHKGPEGNDPIFLYYDMAKTISRFKGEGEPSLTYTWHESFSTSSRPQQQILHIWWDEENLNENPLGHGNSLTEMTEIMWRLGRLENGTGSDLRCRQSILLIGLSEELGNANGPSISIEDVSNLYKSKPVCGRCRPSEVDCIDSVGHMLFQSMKTNEITEPNTLPTRTGHNHFAQAVWNDEGSCSAEHVYFNKFIDKRSPLGKVCASALQEFGGCSVGLKDAKCGKLASTSGVNLWKKVVANINPAAIGHSATVAIYVLNKVNEMQLELLESLY